VGSVYADNANTITAPGYQLLDLFASYRVTKNATLTARVRNATDKLYVSNATGTPLFIFGEPRSFELSLRATY
jgi:iron complex outermembrane receptor protein